MNDFVYKTYLQILKEELVPAMGCTEPISIAYAASKVCDVLGGIPEKTRIEVCGNIIKNVKSVVVPNTGGLRGIKAAVAAGYVSKRPDLSLEVLSVLKYPDIAKIKKCMTDTEITIVPSKKPYKFYIEIDGYRNDSYVKVIIIDYHTNIVLVERNQEILFKSGYDVEEENAYATDRRALTIDKIFGFANNVKIADVEEIIDRQIEYNSKIAKVGLEGKYSSAVGKTLIDLYGNDVKIRAKAYPAAGSDARMGGCDLPVVIVSGSGNQGMTTSLPVIEYAKELGVSHEKLIRALVLANLVTIDEKKEIGRLSAFCGAVSAACGAAAGICYLFDGSYEEICSTIKNSLGITSGMVCDGAKASCAAKISAAVDAGLLGFYLTKNNHNFKAGDGILASDVDDTINNVGTIAREGMQTTDEKILKIMVED